MPQTTNPRTAQEHYTNQQTRVATDLKRLTSLVDAHRLRQATQPKNWGYGGDLEHIAGRLEELIDFLG